MPKLRVFPCEGDSLNNFILLVQKSELCAQAKITNTKETNLFQNVLPGQFDRNSIWTQKILQSQWSHLHYITYIQAINPFVLVQIAKNVFHIRIANI